MDETHFTGIDPHNTTLYLRGKQWAVKSAVVGSIVFAFADLAGIYINTYLIEHIDAPSNSFGTIFNIGYAIALILLGCALAYFPASLLGKSLAKSLENDANKHALSGKIAVAKGMLFGAIAGIVSCLPILFLTSLLILLTWHGDLVVMIYRSGIATAIASLAGGWTGKQLEKLISK